MRFRASVAPLLLIASLAGCGGEPVVCCGPAPATVRVVNAFTTPVDVYVDGRLVIHSLAAGAVAMSPQPSGSHTLGLGAVGAAATVSRSITTPTGAIGTIAAVRASTGALSSVALDDTNSIVPAGATKLRVVHFAPNAGTLQVYRTQPDYQQPIAWQTPFDYQADPTSLSAPFYQSTVGTWEVRIWQTPADSTGWTMAPLKVVVPLGSGAKKTILILDAAGGGVRTELL